MTLLKFIQVSAPTEFFSSTALIELAWAGTPNLFPKTTSPLIVHCWIETYCRNWNLLKSIHTYSDGWYIIYARDTKLSVSTAQHLTNCQGSHKAQSLDLYSLSLYVNDIPLMEGLYIYVNLCWQHYICYIAQFAMPQIIQSYNLTMIKSPSGLRVMFNAHRCKFMVI